MQKIKLMLTRELSRKDQGYIVLGAVTCAAVGLVGIILTPPRPQGLSLLALVVFAGILGALSYRAFVLIRSK